MHMDYTGLNEGFNVCSLNQKGMTVVEKLRAKLQLASNLSSPNSEAPNYMELICWKTIGRFGTSSRAQSDSSCRRIQLYGTVCLLLCWLEHLLMAFIWCILLTLNSVMIVILAPSFFCCFLSCSSGSMDLICCYRSHLCQDACCTRISVLLCSLSLSDMNLRSCTLNAFLCFS
ncbi:uncharacterized protein LOC112175360 [Rosa chinensis]|uniref:uncharacterized protein LOC112175360 n=1 Tax=Rosa chinensis TaxID=74649 RepID=UPI000D097AA6|nr:uncharacterized protein LOC112175360 [Rosa chinensis]